MTRTVPVVRCTTPGAGPPSSWPQAAQTGLVGELRRVGSLDARLPQVVCSAAAPVSSGSLAVLRAVLAHGRPALVSILRRARLTARRPITLDVGPASIVLDVAAQTTHGSWRQRFLVARDGSVPTSRAGLLDESLCDGTSGHILTPAFAGPHALPLRVAVSSPFPATVAVTDPLGRAFARRTISTRGRTTLSIPTGHGVTRGIYRVAISVRRSPLGQTIQLSALAL